jgi:glycosyltransferase involved in cell wall biosynthesis
MFDDTKGSALRILWLSNFSSDSAYAIQAQLMIPRLIQAGHEIAVLELTLGRNKPRVVNGINILPVGKDGLGSDSVLDHFRRGGFHAVVSLVDAWGLNPNIMKQVPWFPFAPIDTQPVSPRNVEALKACIRPIALTQWAAGALTQVGMTPLYVPHGFDPHVWHPGSMAKARDELGIAPHVFMASFVGVNDSLPSRKGIAEMLFAWHIFRANHPECVLYLHTDPVGNIPEKGDFGGVDIFTQLKSLGLEGDDSIRMVDVFRYRTQSIPHTELATIAQASDVLLLTSKGEGFGVPIIEFAAAGTPAIVTNFGSAAELAGQMGGILVDFEPDWGWQNALTAKPLVGSIVAALELAYSERATPAAVARRQQALQGVQAYAIDEVFLRYAVPAFETIGELALEVMH